MSHNVSRYLPLAPVERRAYQGGMSPRSTLRPRSMFGIALMAIALSGACKGAPKAGDACSVGHGVCVDAKSMMACIKGVFAPIPCQGATACAANGEVSECDNSISSVGDACDEIGDYACSHDMKAALSC